MNYIEYQNGAGTYWDVAPESYLDIGCIRLMRIEKSEYERIHFCHKARMKVTDRVAEAIARVDMGLAANNVDAVY